MDATITPPTVQTVTVTMTSSEARFLRDFVGSFSDNDKREAIRKVWPTMPNADVEAIVTTTTAAYYALRKATAPLGI